MLHSPDQQDPAGPTAPETTPVAATETTVTPITSAIRTLHTAHAEEAVTVCDRAHRDAVADAEELEAQLAAVVIPLDSDAMTLLRANDRKRDLRLGIAWAWSRASTLSGELDGARGALRDPQPPCEVPQIHQMTLRSRLTFD